MKKFTPLLLLIFITVITSDMLIGQVSNERTIIIVNQNDEAIPHAHITINRQSHLLSDNNGAVNILQLGTSIDIKVSHVAYLTIDTTINNNYKIDTIRMQPNSYTIDPITISDKKRLLEKQDWYLTDMCLHEYGILVSAREESKKYIYLYNKEGVQIQKVRTKFKHNKIEKGLKSGHYYITNNKSVQEIFVSTDSIIFLNEMPFINYENTIHQFIHTASEFSIIKEWSQHNKQIILYHINHADYEKKPFYRTFDREKYTVSQDAYKDIIIRYMRNIELDDPQAIDYGIRRENIIARGEWSGDLIDLVIDNDTQAAYSTYIHLHQEELPVSTAVLNEKLYILDDKNKQLTVISLAPKKEMTDQKKLDIPDNIVNGAFITSDIDEGFVISSDNGYFFFNIYESKFHRIEYDIPKFQFPKSTFVIGDVMYVLARKNLENTKHFIYTCPKKPIP